jgi:hypothetical protein
MEIPFGREDFELLAGEGSANWDEELAQANCWDVMECSPDTDSTLTGWEFVYWVGEQWLNAVFARAWLKEQNEPYVILWDTKVNSYAVLTNYDVEEGKD